MVVRLVGVCARVHFVIDFLVCGWIFVSMVFIFASALGIKGDRVFSLTFAR